MAEYIDANKKVTIQVYDDMTEEWHKKKYTIAEVLDKWTDEGCPRPTAIPVKHGVWIIDKSKSLMCSKCGTLLDEAQKPSRYCPNCGAKMDEVEEDNDGN
jgi:rubrerythrin